MQEDRLSLLPSGCICPGSELTFTCTIQGGGLTLWRGSFINNCIGNSEGDISFRHGVGFTQHSETCNEGAVTATALRANDANYTSELTINMTMMSLSNGSTVTCFHDNDTAEIVVGTWTMIGKQWYC